jgi:rhamnosyltransferase
MNSNSTPKIYAIIVSWNPLPSDVLSCIENLTPQVHKIIYSDNGSRQETRELLEKLKNENLKVECVWNGKNLGVATALNRGVVKAKKEGADWVLTLDHDSVPEKTMVQKMLNAYRDLSEKERKKTAILCPNFMLAKGVAYPDASPRFIETSITSGQLVKTTLFDAIGLYEDKLFIECVDHEFCLRTLTHGYKTLLIPSAILKQQIGHPSVKKVFGKTFTVPNYSPERYYYQIRNTIFIYKKYFATAPGWIIKNIPSTIYSLGKVILYEDEPLKKMGFAARGVLDGLRGNGGELNKKYD